MEKAKFTAKVIGLLLLVPVLFFGILLHEQQENLPAGDIPEASSAAGGSLPNVSVSATWVSPNM